MEETVERVNELEMTIDEPLEQSDFVESSPIHNNY